MNIFIYGSDAFKDDINNVLDRSNIKFRLTDNDSLQVVGTLIELRTAIENYPQDIFLIDDSKIFRKNALNKKMKFLKPSDAVEEEFLKEHGIGDFSVNSLEELPKHIIKKIESERGNEDDDYYDSNDNSDIQESIIDIVDEAYNSEENSDETSSDLQNRTNDDRIDLDDELSSLLSSNHYSEDEEDETANNELLEEDNMPLDEVIDESEIQIDEKEGEDMADEFSELDSLNENDILAALDGLDDIDINSMAPAASKPAQQNVQNSSSEQINLSGANADDIASLITQLLNNKTLEITVKVKA